MVKCWERSSSDWWINIPRQSSDHGGIGILYRCSLKLQIFPTNFNTQTFEHAIIFDKVRKIYCVITYRPPPSTVNGLKTSQFLADFDEFLLYLNGVISGNIILLGDFNVHVEKPQKYDVKHFLSSLDGAGLFQHVVGPTHRSGGTLDVVIDRHDGNLVKRCTVGPRPSDHNIVPCILNVERTEVTKEIICSRKIKNIDPVAFHKDLSVTISSLNSDTDDVNSVTEIYEKAINVRTGGPYFCLD